MNYIKAASYCLYNRSKIDKFNLLLMLNQVNYSRGKMNDSQPQTHFTIISLTTHSQIHHKMHISMAMPTRIPLESDGQLVPRLSSIGGNSLSWILPEALRLWKYAQLNSLEWLIMYTASCLLKNEIKISCVFTVHFRYQEVYKILNNLGYAQEVGLGF